jgi:hypothetical protein
MPPGPIGAPPTRAASLVRDRAPTGAGGVLVRYRDRVPVRVRGPLTGQVYEFSGERPSRWVDARDAEPLLRSRRFTRG